MKASESVGSVLTRVKELLEKYSEFRDDDKMLWLAYLNVHFGLKHRIDPESYNVLREILLSEDTPTSDTVTRVRRKIQEQHVHLQGNKRKLRLKI